MTATYTVQVSVEVQADSDEEATKRVVDAIHNVRPAMDCIVDRVVNQDEAVADIIATFGSIKERVQQWKARTGQSETAFYRRMKELED
jgi:hypothetical protein